LRSRFLAGIIMALIVGGGVRAQKWERLGPEGGMVVSLGAGSGGEVYLGTADGHVFASKDGTQTWELRGRVGSRLDAVVTHLVADPRREDRIIAAVWFQAPGAGGGVFESEDRGKSWKLLGLKEEAVRALEMAPSKPNELVAGTRNGLFLSSDAGKSWTRISPEGDEELRNVDSVAIDPRDPQVIYAGTFHLPWLTRDGGKTWKPIIAGIIDDSDIMSLRLDATNPSRVYMSACSGIYRSENQGGEWIKLQGIPYAARRTQVIVQDPANSKTLYAGTTEGLWVTRDGGESWTRTTSKDWVVDGLIVLGGKSGGPGRVVLGTEGQGVEVSDDGGVTFTQANRGFTHVVVKQLVADDWAPGHLLMMIARSGTEIMESKDDGKSWTGVPLAAEDRGKRQTLDASQVQKAFASPWGWVVEKENGQLWIWQDDKKSWKEWRLVLHATGAAGTKKKTPKNADGTTREVVPRGAIAFGSGGAVLSTKEGLVRCRESGECLRIPGFGSAGSTGPVWVSSDGNEMGAVSEGKLGMSSNGGQSVQWANLPVSAESVLWLKAMENERGETIFLGTREGLSAWLLTGNNAWVKVMGGLPTGGVEHFSYDAQVWAVSERDGGVYISQDQGVSWKRVDEDAERGRFSGLVVKQGRTVLVGSESEGLLELELRKSAEAGKNE